MFPLTKNANMCKKFNKLKPQEPDRTIYLKQLRTIHV